MKLPILVVTSWLIGIMTGIGMVWSVSKNNFSFIGVVLVGGMILVGMFALYLKDQKV